MLRIEALEVTRYALPFREPYVTSRGQLDRRELLLVEIRSEGLIGLGETTALSLRGGTPIERIADELSRVCSATLREAPVDPSRLWQAIARCRSRGAGTQALAAVDIALHDLAGKALDRPVWALLRSVHPVSAGNPDPVRCNATLPMANPAQLAKQAEVLAADGFGTFKLKVGVPGDRAQVEAVRSALGPDVKIRVDANGAWTASEAVERLRALARHTIELAEEPCSGLRELANLRGRTRIRLAADESVSSPRDAREAKELGACEMATVKLAKVGGPLAALEAAGELPVYLSSALEGPVGIAAAAHTAAALPRSGDARVAHGLATERLFAEWPGSGPSPEGGAIALGSEAGLGVQIDAGAVERLRVI